jgi:broad specificity phosphatase PhoE
MSLVTSAATREQQRAAIAAAAKELNELRERWLNPPEWTVEKILEFPGSVNGAWARYVVKPNKNGVGTPETGLTLRCERKLAR